MIKRIVAAVDGAHASMAAFKDALGLVDPEGTVLAVIVEDFESFYHHYAVAIYGGNAEQDVQKFGQQWAVDVDRLQAELLAYPRSPKITVQCTALETAAQGRPALVLYHWALAAHAKLILVGHRREPMRPGDYLGSFPRWLVHHNVVPMMVVP
jgi:nucleotide-binding universal stress UspA family protein